MAEDIPIKAKVVEEVLGSPKEHVMDTLQKVVLKIKEGFKVTSEKLYEPEEVQGLWSSFVELEIEFKSMRDLIGYCFDFMPSSLEIYEPKEFKVESKDYDDMMNDLLARLHRYDMYVKNLRAENKLLNAKKKEDS